MREIRAPYKVFKASITALIIQNLQKRYIKSANTDRSIAFLWIFLEPMMHVGVWISVRMLYGIKITVMPTAVFILIGTVPFLLVLKCIPQFISSINANKQLLKFKQIKASDFTLAILLSEFLVLSTVFFILLIFFIGLNLDWHIYHPEKIIYASFYLLTILFGIGLTLSTIGFFIPFIKNFTLIITRLLYFTSGVFFPASSVPAHIREILWWNPLFQVIELYREAFINLNSHLEFISHDYLISLSLCSLTLGMGVYLTLRTEIMIKIEQF